MQHKYGGDRRTPFFLPLPVPLKQAFLIRKLIVYGNGGTNPTITIPHGMIAYHEVKRN